MRSRAYRELWRVPGLRWQALSGLVAQVTQGAGAVGVILVVGGQAHSLALAGAVVGGLSIAAGVARPLQGRLIDRRGAATLMGFCGVIHPAALIGIVALSSAHAPGVMLVALGVLAGAALPPVSTSMRVSWGAAVPEGDRTAAYSLVFLTQELSILTGPLVLAALIASTNAKVALTAVAGLAAAGTLAFALLARDHRSPVLRSERRSRVVLRERGMAPLVTIAGLIGGVVGAIEVAVPTFATAHRAPAASGLLIAALSVGGIAGAALYGARPWGVVPARRLAVLLALMAVSVALLIPVGPLLAAGVLLALVGISLNPSLTTISLLVDEYLAATGVAEAFGWLSSGIAGGGGLANVISSALVHHGRAENAFAFAAGCAAAAALLAAFLSRSRERSAALPHPSARAPR